ncbi:MAG: hypothetical protein JJU05_05865 [Verrucomicrobia bacterium]|nr:hypothetical protein [Verrucomicrobiota bacterium]MCH8525667.1 hypothetical protein [Kiritimatiellia bacterium]
MKKLLKIFLFLFVGILLIVLLSATFILNSAGIQTSVVRRGLPDGMTLEKAHFGPGGLTVEQLHGEVDSVKISMERLRVDFPLMGTLFSRKLHIRELSLTGLVLDLTDFEPAPPAEPVTAPPRDPSPVTRTAQPSPAEAFEGLFQDIKWHGLIVDSVSIEALVILPGGLQNARLTLSGNDITPKSQPKLQLVLAYEDHQAEAVVPLASLTTDLSLTLRNEDILTGILVELLADVDVRLEERTETLQISGALDLSENADRSGEDYSLRLTLFPGAENAADLVTLQAAFESAERALSGTWSINADTRTAAFFVDPLLNGAWARAAGEGRFTFATASQISSTQGTFSVEANELENFRPELASVPTFLLDSAFDLSANPEKAEVRELRLLVAAPRETPLIQMDARQVFGINLETNEPFFSTPGEPLIEMALSGLPVELINGLAPDLNLTIESFGGRLILSGEGQTLRLTTTEPVTLRGLSLAPDGEPLVSDLTLSLAPSAAYDPKELSFDLGELTLTGAEQEIAGLRAAGSITDMQQEPEVELTADWQVNLPALLAQPFGKPFRNTSEGVLAGTLNAKGGESDLTASLDLSLRDLRVTDTGDTVSALTLALEILLAESDRISVSGPLRIAAADQTTDFDLGLTLDLSAEVPDARFQSRSENVYSEHFTTLAAAFANPDAAAPAPSGAAEESEPVHASREPDQSPVWDGVLAHADLEINRIILPGNITLKDLKILASVTEQEAMLETFSVVIDDAVARAKGGLRFREDHPEKPYQLSTELSFRDFNVGNFLRNADPGEEPVLEAVISMVGGAAGEAPNLGVLAEFITGEFKFSAENGTLRALRRGAVSAGAQAGGVTGRLGGLVAGRGDVEAIGQLATYFNAIEFETLSLEVNREPNFDLALTDFTLRNQDLRLRGSGKVTHVEDQPLTEHPLRLELTIAARPPLANLFESIRLLQEIPDESGFRSLLRPVVIQGTVAKPDARALWTLIAEAGARAAAERAVRPSEKPEGDQPEGEAPAPTERRRPRIPSF